MATYVNNLRLKEIATGDESGTWGSSTNTNLELIGEALGFGTEAITTNADTHTTTVADGSSDAGRAMYLKYTGTLDSACTITIAPNTMKRMQFIENGTSGSQNIIISQGSGANITIPPGDTKAVYLDGAGSGAAVVDAFASLSTVDLKVQDDLTVTDDVSIGGALTLTGNGDFNGDLDVDGTTNLDVVDIDGAVDMASTLQVDGAITSSAGATITTADNTDTLSLVSTDADANAGPNLRMYRNSGSPADSDAIGLIDFEGRNDNSQDVVYAAIDTRIVDASDGTEDGRIEFATILAGTAGVSRVLMDATETVFNDNSKDLDFRVESDGNANMFVVDGGNNCVSIGGAPVETSDTLNVVETTANGVLARFISANDDAQGAKILLQKNTSSPADNDEIAEIDFVGRDSSGNAEVYGAIQVFADDVTSGTEDGIMTFSTTSAGTFSEVMRINPGGNLGIGTNAPAFANGTGVEIQRAGIATLRLEDTGSGGKPFEVFVDDATACHLKGTASGLGMVFSIINSERARIGTTGNLLVGGTGNVGVGNGGLRLVYGSGESDGETFFVGNGGGSNAQAVTMLVVSGEGFNTNHGALHVGRHTGNNRSINAGGTINASGADYAEYMLKSDGCADIAKGEVCGVDADGKLTKTFSAAKSFVIKSTDPSYVGGDTWWTEKEPQRYTDEGKTEYTTAWKDWQTRREAARVNVDRIAFSGQVPVNITGSFSVGDYVYPQANGSNIECVAKTTPTFEEYQLCVGKIWTTMDDGRPLVAVKIG